jgi:archaellum biogenesis ATPase FlaH
VGKFVGRVPGEVARVWPKVANDLAKELAADQYANGLPLSDSQNDQGDNLEDEPSTWLAHDLTGYLTGVYVPLQPTMLQRADGHSLIYPGKIHSIYGESESGKSFVMQALCATEIMLGNKVLYVDFEDSPAEIVHRLRLFGASVEQITDGFTYVQPGESLSTIKAQRAFRSLLASTYSLCIIDGYTTAMNIISPSSGTPEAQVTAFMSALPRRIVRHTKAAVITVDHVVKSKDSRGRFAVGSQEKLNQITGAGYSIEVVNMIAPGARGELVMRVTKDRIGQVRANGGKYRASDRTQEVARIHVDSTDPTWINVDIANPTGQGASDWKPTYYMQRVSEYLETCPAPVSSADIKSNVTGKNETIVMALQMLVTDGFVERSEGARGTNLHKSISPYFDLQSTFSDE